MTFFAFFELLRTFTPTLNVAAVTCEILISYFHWQVDFRTCSCNWTSVHHMKSAFLSLMLCFCRDGRHNPGDEGAQLPLATHLLSDQRTNFDIVHSVLMLYGPLSCWTTSFWPSEGLYIGRIKTLFSRRCRQCRSLSLFEHNSSCLRSDRTVFVVHWTKTRTITVSYLVFRFGHMNYSIRLCVWLLWRCALVTARGRAVSVAAAAVSRSALAARVRL